MIRISLNENELNTLEGLDAGAYSREDLSAETSLSVSLLNKVLGKLFQAGLVLPDRGNWHLTKAGKWAIENVP